MAVQPTHLPDHERGGGRDAGRINQRPDQSGTYEDRLHSLVHGSIEVRGLRAYGGHLSAVSPNLNERIGIAGFSSLRARMPRERERCTPILAFKFQSGGVWDFRQEHRAGDADAAQNEE